MPGLEGSFTVQHGKELPQYVSTILGTILDDSFVTFSSSILLCLTIKFFVTDGGNDSISHTLLSIVVLSFCSKLKKVLTWSIDQAPLINRGVLCACSDSGGLLHWDLLVLDLAGATAVQPRG